MLYFRKCHPDTTPAAWQVAVQAEVKATRTLVLDKMLTSKFAKHFIKSNRPTVFYGLSKDKETEKIVEQTSSSPGVDKVRKVLTFEEESEKTDSKNSNNEPSAVSTLKKCESESSKEVDATKKIADVTIIPVTSKTKRKSDEILMTKFNFQNCSVQLSRRAVNNFLFKHFSRNFQELKNCLVKLNDIKDDDTWGVIVKDKLGISELICVPESPVKPSELDELDINKNLSPRKPQYIGEPVCSSTPTKSDDSSSAQTCLDTSSSASKPVNLAEQVDPVQVKETLDLNIMKRKVGEGAYENVLDFHLDIKRLRESAKIGGPAKKRVIAKFNSTYEKAMTEFCPWFDFKNPLSFFEPKSAEENVMRPPNLDHHYSVTSVTNNNEKSCEQNLVSFWKKKFEKTKDRRFCVLCGKLGDAPHDRAGRLLYFRQNEWVHVR